MSSLELCVSTRNRHKLEEFRALLSPIGSFDVVTAEAAGVPDVEETGATFLDNAVLKAAAAFRVTGGLCLADDSGLAVDALGGAPGVFSARFSGPDATAESNNAHLLQALEGVVAPARTAAFVCHLALVVPGSVASRVGDDLPATPHPDLPPGAALYALAGRVAGRILSAPRGAGGFGYDPLFLHPPSAQTFAEMAQGAKNAVSHRGRALQQLATLLRSLRSAP
jgi:XTP/dITP diphosphohydrolase